LGDKAASVLVERDYAKTPLTAEEIKTIFGSDPIPPFLNTRHAVYKERGFSEKLPASDELIKLIIPEPNLLRRPITRRGNRVIIGFDQASLLKLVQIAIARMGQYRDR
jgi:arsenate reductase-like glutaredoxin family protein